ncbi:HNH endonuclease [Saliphagus sp. GCM10025308]
MDTEKGASTLDPEYIAGLLDSTARVRFNISEQPDDTFTVRPQLRIKPYETEMREAVVGTFLDSRDYTYDLVDRERGHGFFLLSQRSDLADLEEFLRGHSTSLIRELEFVTGPGFERYDTNIMDPEEAYRFLLTRDELRYEWRPRGINHWSPSRLTDAYDLDENEVSPSELPAEGLTPNSSTEYIAGVFDGLCRYRPTITESSENRIGYSMYPTARLTRGGVDPAMIDSFRNFCRTYDLTYGDSSKDNSLWFVFTGANAIRRVLDVVFPHLLVLADHSISLVEDVLPRFDARAHHEKQGFYDLLRGFDVVATASGGPFRHREYDPAYFEEIWSDELDTTRRLPESNHEHDIDEYREPSGEVAVEFLEYPDSIVLTSDDYEDELGRFGSVADRTERDEGLVSGLKQMYKDRCQVCGTRRAKPDGTGYSEVHHLRPLFEDGADTLENMLVLCPNHHADLDNGAVRIEPDTKTVRHPYDPGADGRALTVLEGDAISEDAIRYYNDTVSNISPNDGVSPT